jgi:hypothetical protein
MNRSTSGFEEDADDDESRFETWDPSHFTDGADSNGNTDEMSTEVFQSHMANHQSAVKMYWDFVDSQVDGDHSGMRSYIRQSVRERVQMPPLEKSTPSLNGPQRNQLAISLDQEASGMVEEIMADYSKSIAQGVCDYHLTDVHGHVAKQKGINKAFLKAESKWWVNNEYQTHEWRVLRNTGIVNIRATLVSGLHRMRANLCITEAIMHHLQVLWLDADLPAEWGKSSTSGGAATQVALNENSRLYIYIYIYIYIYMYI